MWASPLETQHCASNSGRLHCSRSCTPVQRNAGDSLRAPGSKQLVRQPCLAQTTYPGASGYHPHFATFPPFGLSGSCGCNASTHMMREAPTPKGGGSLLGYLLLGRPMGSLPHSHATALQRTLSYPMMRAGDALSSRHSGKAQGGASWESEHGSSAQWVHRLILMR